MTVGLNSNIKQSDFKRKKQNIVVLLDISGSMSSNLNDYYYDAKDGPFSKAREFLESKEDKSKMKLANESINLMLDKLNGDDRFGMVLFDDKAYLAKPINLTEETNMDKIKEHILEIEARGGTNFEAGYTKATELFTKELLNDDEYDNRIIVITDAMPNMGTTSKKGLLSYVKENAQNKIYTSFIGIGVDFNTDSTQFLLAKSITDFYTLQGEDVLIVAYPPLSTSNIPSALLHDANANILVASADRGWKTIDKQLCEQLTQQLSKTDVPFRICLTNANRDAVEDFTGQLPPHTLLRRIGYRLSQLSLTEKIIFNLRRKAKEAADEDDDE